MKRRVLSLLGIVAIAVAGCGSGKSGQSAATTSSTPAASTPATTAPCKYPVGQGPDVIERDVTPGQPAVAQELGEHALCGLADRTSTDPGFCSQIAFASSNPGYDVNASPAPALKGVIDQAGAGC